MNWDAPIEWLLTQGVLGLCVLALGFVVIQLYRACNISEQGRLSDAKESLPVLETVKATLTAQLAAMESRNRQVDKIVEALQAMEARVDALMKQNDTNLLRAFERLDQLTRLLDRRGGQ